MHNFSGREVYENKIYLNSMYSYIMTMTILMSLYKLYKNVDLNLARTQDFPKIIGS